MTQRNYALVKSNEHLGRFVDKLLAAKKPFAFDIETTYLGPLRAKGALQHYAPDYRVAGISFTNDPSWARYASLNHVDGPNLDNLQAAKDLWRLLRSGKGIPHNAVMELSGMARFFRDWLWNVDEVIPGTNRTYAGEVLEDGGLYPIFSDTMIESMLTGEHQRKGLKDLSHDILGVPQVELMTLFKDRNIKGLNDAGKLVKYNTNNLRFGVLPLDPDVVSYACEDSALTLEHHARTYPQVKDLMVYKMELRLQPVIVRMEREGMLLDWPEYERRAKEVELFRDEFAEYVMNEFSRISGQLININLNSPAQVADVLFNKMGIKPTMMTKGNKPSTGEKAMRLIVNKHPEIKSLLQYREVAKLLGTYLNKYLKEFRYDTTGRAHPSHNQGGTVTGRFSVDGVSYQQWPKPYHYELPSGATLDLNYRNFLISPEGYRIVGFDYANVELRIVSGLAKERAMLEAFARGDDIHKATASLMLRVALEDVSYKQRGTGKTLNFAILYQSGAENIASLITAATGELCTVEQAEGYLKAYMEAFPDLAAWMDETKLEGRQVHEKLVPTQAAHWVTTMFGRRVPIFEYDSPYRSVRSKADRNAVNSPVQGSAADYMKAGMVRADKVIREAEADGRLPKDSVKLIMTIHDALEFYVRKDVSTTYLKSLLEPAISYPVHQDWLGNELVLPVVRADWHEGYRWGTVADLEEDENGELIYTRKLELPDKTKHVFTDSSLDGLNAQIDKFWADQGSTELDSRTINDELEFEYDEEEDDFFLSGANNIALLVDSNLTGDSEGVTILHQESLFNAPKKKESTVAPKVEPIREEVPVEDDEPPWLHVPKSPTGAHLRLILQTMPTRSNWPKFQKFIKDNPGEYHLVVTTPQGDVTFDNVNVSPKQEVDLQLIFGEATLRLEEEVSVSDEVMKGMAL